MFEIKGKVNTAICYADVYDEHAVEQIKNMCDYELTRDSKIRIMPDVHAGKGCTIGTTMTVSDKVCPNIVGVDIGCGMYVTKVAGSLDFEKIDATAHFIPSNNSVWTERKEHFDLTELKCYRNLKDTKRLERSIGTLGGGNHFIEIDQSDDNTYLVIHSGSRNLGTQVATYYQNLAIDLHSGKEEYFKKRDEIIKEYKAAGRRDEIQEVLKKEEAKYKSEEPDVPRDLCWLTGDYVEDYLHDVKICQDFAVRSREKMAQIIMDECHLEALESFHTIHNYIDTDEMILRKGAIAAHKGERVLIPINMRDGSIIALGRGSADWNFSAPHGAGRLMSRTEAMNTLDMQEFEKSMEGIYTTSVKKSTLDEAPAAYKSKEDIIDAIAGSVDIIEELHPLYNFKA